MAELRIDVTDDPWREAEQDFVAVCRRLEAGETVEPLNRLLLPSWQALAALLSPQRVDLLNSLRREPAVSVTSLANRLGRDGKTVFEDVQALEAAGLITRTSDDHFMAPYASVGASLEFAA